MHSKLREMSLCILRFFTDAVEEKRVVQLNGTAAKHV